MKFFDKESQKMLTEEIFIFFYLTLSFAFLILIHCLYQDYHNQSFFNFFRSRKSVENKIVISGIFRDSFLSLSPEDKFKSIDIICKTDFDYIRIHFIRHGTLFKYDIFKNDSYTVPCHKTNKTYPKKDEVCIYLKYQRK